MGRVLIRFAEALKRILESTLAQSDASIARTGGFGVRSAPYLRK